MKRKLVKQGNSALTITLPISWVKKYCLQAGAEINAEERGKDLLISVDKEFITDKVSYDISNLDERTVRWLLSSLHKAGYDEIEVHYKDARIFSVINELLKDLFIGFTIVEQSQKRLVLKSISKDMPEEFDHTLKRAFLVTLSMGDSLLDYMKQGRFADMGELISLEHTNNQLTNFCERSLNKFGYKEFRKNHFMYVIAWNLEKVCDEYKYMCDYLSEKHNVKLGKEILTMVENSNSFLKCYFDLFYSFDTAKLNILHNQRKELEKEIIGNLKKFNQDELVIANHLLTFIRCIADFSASTIAIHTL